MTELDSFAQSLRLSEHKHIFEYWRNVAPAGGLPGRQHIDPLEIPAHILPWILLVDVVPENEQRRFRFRLVGTGNVARYGRDTTGMWFEEAYEGKFLERQQATYEEVCANSMPHLSHNTLPLEGQEFTSYKRLLLPFCSDGRTVDLIMAVMVFDDRAPGIPG